MSEENTENAPAPTEGDAPTTEPATETAAEPEAAPEKTASVECPSSPTKEHDMFHNEGTDETYCRYCGKTS